MKKIKRVRVGPMLIVLLVAADVLGTFGYYWAVREGVRSDRLPAHGTAVILFSAMDVDGFLDGETRRRIHHAAEIIRQKESHLIICCGGTRPQTGRYGSLFMRDYLIELGFDPMRVVAEKVSNSTLSNIRSAAALLDSMSIIEATLISSPIHLPRVRHAASKGAGHIAFDYSAYALEDGEPSVGPLRIYFQIHHEWAAWMAGAVLPEGTYTQILNRLRQ